MYNLLCKYACIIEPIGIERDLADHCIIGHHHGNRTEQHLQIVRQLRAPGVARIHRDENVTRRIELQVRIFKGKLDNLLRDGMLNGEYLLRHDRKHFQLDTVELIEARPRAGLSETLEELAERLVVQPVGTVEHDTLFGDGFGKIFARFRLTGTRRTFRCTTKVELEGTHQRAEASIGEGSRNETSRIAEILHAVLEVGSYHANTDVTLLVIVVYAPVVP